ncbi:metal ABC transporter ATP-binding protein [Limisalsivibrio acetivorans]|uniref:metal ABC transporter ATP-binding protein n=1 Tax=Limisalsivibrio acetivorans TaxID=1304888 RepID=UPI0003B475E4|nr:metal ABC transporter ATP-binding protein [Limisalsivibrio acetivorans]
MKAVEIRGLDFAYNGRNVLEDVELDINEGEFLGMIGPNGGGKSTLVKLILGILLPDRGEIRVFGEEPRKNTGCVGYVPQNLAGSAGIPATAFETAMMGLSLRKGRLKKPDREDVGYVEELMDYLDVSSIRDSMIDNLSGGQRQRVFIARALAMRPKVLFLDEPTSSVDTKGQRDLFDKLKELNRDMTIVVVSHDLGVLPRFASSIAMVNTYVHKHEHSCITEDMMKDIYGDSHHTHDCAHCGGMGIGAVHD